MSVSGARLLAKIPAPAAYLCWALVLTLMFLGAPNFAPWTGTRNTILGGDFMQFYLAGTLVRDGLTERLYDLQFQQAYQLRPHWLPFEWRNGAVSLFAYPPHVAVLFAPLASLDYRMALLVWELLIVGSLFAAVEVLVRVIPEARVFRGAVILGLLAFMPAVHCIYSAQNSTISLLVLSGVLFLLTRGRESVAGAALGLLLYKPQLVPLFPLLMLYRRRVRFVATFGSIALLTALIPLLIDPELLRGFLRIARDGTRWILMPGMPTQNMTCWYGFWFNLFGENELPLVQAVTVMCSAVTVICGALRARALSDDLPAVWSVTTLAALLVSPHVLHYDLTLLALPAIAATRRGGFEISLASAVLVTAVLSPAVCRMTGLQIAVPMMFVWMVLFGRAANRRPVSA